MKIAFETHPNKALLTIHTSIRMPSIGMFMSDTITDDAEDLKQKLLGIDGVQEVTARDYQVRIERGAVFTFEDLKPKIIKALEDFTSDSVNAEVLPYS